jgi:hypothetical protein
MIQGQNPGLRLLAPRIWIQRCALESVHYIGKMCTSEYPYVRLERRLVIKTKDGKLVHNINTVFQYFFTIM